MTHYNNRRDFNVIDLTRISSANATHAKPGVSDSYAFVPTSRMTEILADHGWHPVGAKETRVRAEENRGFQKHEIRFGRQEDGLVKVRDARPEIRLLNSHGGASSFQLWAGILELVCLNGLVAWSETMREVRIRHSGFAVDLAEQGIREITSALPRALARREQMQTLQLTEGERSAFAEAAVAVRWGNEVAPVAPSQLLVPTRYEQRTSTLWDTFNTVQERLIRGGVRGRNAQNRRMTTRAVAGVTEDLRINQGLWILADRMATMKGAVSL